MNPEPIPFREGDRVTAVYPGDYYRVDFPPGSSFPTGWAVYRKGELTLAPEPVEEKRPKYEPEEPCDTTNKNPS
jgi:hypothetical protein